MKTMRFGIYLSLSIMILSVCFVSCSKDEDSVGWGRKGIVSKIVVKYSENDSIVVNYSYDKNWKLTKIDCKGRYGPKIEQRYTFVGNKLMISRSFYSWDGSIDPPYTYECTLDVKGKVASWIDLYDGFNLVYENGYLVRCENLFCEGDDYGFIWEKGNLKEINVPGEAILRTFTYTDYPNKMNVDILDFYPHLSMIGSFSMFNAGYFGKRNKKLLKETSDGGYPIKLRYKFDKNGYVTRFNVTIAGSMGQGLEGVGTVTYVE